MGRHSETQSFTHTSIGTKTPWLVDEPGVRLFQISGSWTSLSMSIQGSIFGTTWVTLESGITAAAGFLNVAPWPMYRVVISTLSGGGQSVTIDFLVEKFLRAS